MAAPRPPSLKARALQWLAQREHSRLELGHKLLRAARAGHRAPAAAAEARPSEEPFDAAAARAAIAQLLDELERAGWLAPERFVESRVRARLARFGNQRIAQELAAHHLALPEDAARALVQSEPARARAVRERRFARAPDTPEERARQARFLAARGFSADVIHSVLREAARAATDAAREDARRRSRGAPHSRG
jgi:regulatory protein